MGARARQNAKGKVKFLFFKSSCSHLKLMGSFVSVNAAISK